jgi:hypothetical protein
MWLRLSKTAQVILPESMVKEVLGASVKDLQKDTRVSTKFWMRLDSRNISYTHGTTSGGGENNLAPVQQTEVPKPRTEPDIPPFERIGTEITGPL